ncbi:MULTISPECIES: hypothetical protein [Delftia]|uniref:hypothetical protein n=1 Tax=Delftia TaxID=80865 RepID=UPI0005C206B3|nr:MULTISPECIES: hypothetical protein [Delftia]MCP4014944.1 hypothetical protein [Delftia sp.]MCP4530223.1 hypothetical protein [Delftia sp.]OLE04292.1 MAG: hypothetical protein AUG53_23165 [Delftia sp. 13_1_20CM_4_67_18]QPS74994.1 hypothetical protein I6G48_31080 [Delftia acidovorans]
MKAISVEITRLVDDSAYPPLVECILVDAQGRTHRFVEKDAIVSSAPLPVDQLPVPGAIACEVESEWIDAAGRSLVSASTTKPWGVESTAGTSNFVVLAGQLREA